MATQVNDSNFDAVVLQSQLPFWLTSGPLGAVLAVPSALSSMNSPMNTKASCPWSN